MRIRSVLTIFFVFFSFLSVSSMEVTEVSDSLKKKSNHAIIIDTTDLPKAQKIAVEAVNSLFGESNTFDKGDSLLSAFDKLPAFGIYKDNYFVVGTNVTGEPTNSNSDAKFQISIRHRLTNSKLPFKTYLFLTYTQKAFWDVFQKSFPFRDLNYNPTIGLGKALIYKNRFLGSFIFQFEHESNGKDGIDSRSWNKISATSHIYFDRNWSMSAKVWIPFYDGNNNNDMAKYAGWCDIGGTYRSSDTKYCFNMVINKRAVNNCSANLILNFAVRLFSDENQYLFAEFYNGYGESLLDYKDYRQRLRIGFVIRPKFSVPF